MSRDLAQVREHRSFYTIKLNGSPWISLDETCLTQAEFYTNGDQLVMVVAGGVGPNVLNTSRTLTR